MRIAIADTCPAFDACEQPFNPWAVALDHVAVARLLIGDKLALLVTNPASIGIPVEDGHQILGA